MSDGYHCYSHISATRPPNDFLIRFDLFDRKTGVFVNSNTIREPSEKFADEEAALGAIKMQTLSGAMPKRMHVTFRRRYANRDFYLLVTVTRGEYGLPRMMVVELKGAANANIF